MEKQLDLQKNLHELCLEYPELKGILADVGLGDFVKESALNTISKLMTITKGAWIKNLDMLVITAALRNHGFSLTGSAMTDLGLDLMGDDILDADPMTEWDPASGKEFSWNETEDDQDNDQERELTLEPELTQGMEMNPETEQNPETGKNPEQENDLEPESDTDPEEAIELIPEALGSFRSLSLEQLEALLGALPMEVIFFNAEGTKCYCNKENNTEPVRFFAEERFMENIMRDFRKGSRSQADLWTADEGEPVLCRYTALRGGNGEYLGMLRCRQDMAFARDYFQ